MLQYLSIYRYFGYKIPTELGHPDNIVLSVCPCPWITDSTCLLVQWDYYISSMEVDKFVKLKTVTHFRILSMTEWLLTFMSVVLTLTFFADHYLCCANLDTGCANLDLCCANLDLCYANLDVWCANFDICCADLDICCADLDTVCWPLHVELTLTSGIVTLTYVVLTLTSGVLPWHMVC